MIRKKFIINYFISFVFFSCSVFSANAARFKGSLSEHTFGRHIKSFYEQKVMTDKKTGKICKEEFGSEYCDRKLREIEEESISSYESTISAINFLGSIDWKRTFQDPVMFERLLLETHNRLDPYDDIGYRKKDVYLIRQNYHGLVLNKDVVTTTLKKEGKIHLFVDYITGLQNFNQGGIAQLSKNEKQALSYFFYFPTSFPKVENEMKIFSKNLIHKLNVNSKNNGRSTEEIAAWAHNRIVAIHPYQNGNGRLARLVANLILALNNKEFFWPSNAELYTKAIDSDVQKNSLISVLSLFEAAKSHFSSKEL